MNTLLDRYSFSLRQTLAALEGIGRYFLAFLVLSLAAIWALFTAIACESYRKEQASSALFTENLASLLEHGVEQDLERYDFALRTVATSFGDSSVASLKPDVRQRLLAAQATDVRGIGSIEVLDRDGKTLFDFQGGPAMATHAVSHDYFRFHAVGATGKTVFISKPLRLPLQGNMWAVGLSRRFDKADGSFGGVVLGMLKEDYFAGLFHAIHLPPNSAITIIHDDGTVLMRSPPTGIGTETSIVPVYVGSIPVQSGSRVMISPVDKVERLFAFKRVGRHPVSIHLGIPTSYYLDAWRTRTAVLAAGFLVLSVMIVMMVITLGHELHRRTLAERRLSDLASTDGVTALFNRRHFDEALELEWRRAARDQGPLALLMIDGDFFKAYNDTYGHVRGDAALRAIAGALRDSVQRPADLVARFGGEEFVVLLPGTDLDGALLVGEAVREAVARLEIPHSGSPLERLTVSIGAAACLPAATGEAVSIIQAADFALYEAKENGRDRVATSERLDLADFSWRRTRITALAS